MGAISEEEHRQIIRQAEDHNFDTIILIGNEFKIIRSRNHTWFESSEEAKAYIVKMDIEEAGILIKGSRSNRLEELGNVIRERLSGK